MRVGVSLPGPFYASVRLGGYRRGPGLVGGLIGLCIWIMLATCKAVLWLVWWMLVFTVWAYAALAMLAVWCYRTVQARRAGQPLPTKPALGLRTALQAAAAPRRR